MKRITYIITHKESTPDRRSNLMCVLDWLNNINEIERVIIIEQDSMPRIEKIIDSGLNRNYELEYKFINNPNTFFNKCWAFNVGAKMANTEWLAFGDNDVIMDVQTLNDVIQSALNDYESFTPYETVFDLTPVETKKVKDEKHYTDIKKKPSSIRGGAPYGGGIFFIKSKSFFDIGAWDERFINWGAEDEDITHRIKKSLKFLSINKNAYQLQHGRTIHSTHQQEFYKDNIKLFISRRDAPLEETLKDYNFDEIGLEDKYTNQ